MQDLTQRLKDYMQKNPNELSQQQFKQLEKEINHPDLASMSDEYCDFLFWCRGLPSRQERFAAFAAQHLPKIDGLRILEVGCGRTARMSRFLSDKGFDITCIDPQLDLSYCKGFKGIRDKFHYRRFDLSDYDFVIAQEPCDATEHVIRACLNAKKPFMISLCGQEHRAISGRKFKNERHMPLVFYFT
jgi:uncharacterized UPF0146 family protein